MHLTDVVGVLADETGVPEGRWKMLARRLKDAGMMSKGSGGRDWPPVHIEDVVKLILAHLSGASYGGVAARVTELLSYVDEDGVGAMEFAKRMLRVAMVEDPFKFTKDDMRSLWVASSLTVIDSPDRPAIVIRMACIDGAEELAFTPDGGEFRPQFSKHIATAQSMPGCLFLAISVGLRKLLTGATEYRTVPATFEVA